MGKSTVATTFCRAALERGESVLVLLFDETKRIFLTRAAGSLPPEPWDSDTAKVWVRALQAATGRRGRLLFHPLRLALTGREAGPDLQSLLMLIGHDRTRARLLGKTA